MKISVEIISWLKDDFNHKSSERLVLEENVSPGTTIMDLLHVIAEKYPKFGQKAFGGAAQALFEYCIVILNGTFLSAPAELNTPLKEGDAIKFSPAFYGG